MQIIIIIISLVVLNFVNLVSSNTTDDFNFVSPTTTATISTEFENSSILTIGTTTPSITTIDPCENNKFEISVIVEDFSIILSWPPDDCLNRKYEIYLNNSLIFVTDNTTITIEELHACSVYHIEILANNQNIFNQFLQTSLPIPFNYTVNNLELVQITTILRATWDLQKKISNCINYFNVTTPDDYELIKSTHRSLDLDITNRKDCETFWLKITPFIDDTISGLPNIRFITLRLPPETPILSVFYTESKTATLKWSPMNDLCEAPTITTICYDNKRNIEKIVNTQKSKVRLRGLTKFTKYSCRSLARNSIGNSTWSQRIEFVTDPDVPSPPTNLTITEITSNQFTIAWSPSDDNSDNITGYQVYIENFGSANHTVDDLCLNITNFNFSINSTTTEFIFNEAFPDFLYFISIFSYNDFGESRNISQEIVTEVGQSEEIRNFTISNEQLTENNTIRLELEWQEPCNSNGPINYVLSFSGRYQSTTDYNLIDNGTIKTTNTWVNLPNIHPGFIYDFTIFALSLNNIQGKTVTDSYRTQDGVPNPPSIWNITDISPEIFEIFWIDAQEKFGEILNYNIDIEVLGPKFQIPEDCPMVNYTRHFTEEILGNSTSYRFKQALPYFHYSIEISAKTSAGYGGKSTKFPHTSLFAKPDPIRKLSISTPSQYGEIYNESATITFKSSCRLNGPFEYFNLVINGSRLNYRNYVIVENSDRTSIDVNLKPDYYYTIKITVFNTEFLSDSIEIQYHSDPGVPQLNPNYKPQLLNSTISKTIVLLNFDKDLFNDSYSGDIQYYAVFLIQSQSSPILLENYGYWSGTKTTWPTLTTNSTDKIYQLTEIFWNPFIDNLTEIFLQIGNDEDENSNVHLQENTEYSIIIRGLTEKTYRDSCRIDFKTGGATVDLALVLGLCFGIPIIIALFVSLFIFKRRYQQKLIVEEETKPATDLQPISIKKFISHYQHLIENSNILKTEYQLIETQSKEMKLPITYAVLPENRRKNRYTNILPFDETRVKLQEIDEDDEISSDYINASYIKGYSGRVEYIATQGPTEATCRDFWKMILQENISMIVMVSQFVEQNKEKCFRYFPNNNEKMCFNENFEVRCLTELDFGNYCVRTIQVKKDNIQRNLTHIQYLEWPDFGVPTSTDSMLQFCYQIRERIGCEGGLIVVHCSAGVGRTGTLIAIDILLQTIDNYQDIDIFKTVLNLRQQRINMVQTEKQYMFIYSCIKDFLENPMIKPVKNEEPIYENVTLKPPSNNNPFTEIESSF